MGQRHFAAGDDAMPQTPNLDSFLTTVDQLKIASEREVTRKMKEECIDLLKRATELAQKL